MKKSELRTMIRAVLKEELSKRPLKEATIINELPYNILDDLADDYNISYGHKPGYVEIKRISVTMSSNYNCMLRIYLANTVAPADKRRILYALFESYASEPAFFSLVSGARLIQGGTVITFSPDYLDDIGIDSMDPAQLM